MNTERNMRNECYRCAHKKVVSCNAHIACAKPDPQMRGEEHGINNGWFIYPILFDPCWKARSCKNFEDVSRVSRAVSQSVSSAE